MEDGKKVGLLKNRCYMETVKTSVVGFYRVNIIYVVEGGPLVSLCSE